MAEWRKVRGYEGLYEVSDAGEVRSVKTGMTVVSRPIHGAYGLYIRLSRTGTSRSIKVEDVVGWSFFPERPRGVPMEHVNGDVNDNRVENLTYAGRAE